MCFFPLSLSLENSSQIQIFYGVKNVNEYLIWVRVIIKYFCFSILGTKNSRVRKFFKNKFSSTGFKTKLQKPKPTENKILEPYQKELFYIIQTETLVWIKLLVHSFSIIGSFFQNRNQTISKYHWLFKTSPYMPLTVGPVPLTLHLAAQDSRVWCENICI